MWAASRRRRSHHGPSQAETIQKVEELLRAAVGAYEPNSPDRALFLAEQATELCADAAPRSALMAGALARASVARFARGEYELALKRYQAAVDIWRELGEPQGLVAGLTFIGTIQRIRGEVNLSLACFEEALAISQSTDWCPHNTLRMERQANALTGIGSVHLVRQDLDLALDFLTRALDIHTKIGPTSILAAGTLNHLGQVYLEMGDLDAAMEQFGRILEIYQTTEAAPRGRAAVLFDIGAVHKRRGELDKAMSYLDQAQIVLAGRPSELAVNVVSAIGDVWLERGDIERAHLACQQGLEIAEALGPKSLGTARALIAMGKINRARGDLKAALAVFERALDVAQAAVPTSAETVKALENLAAIHQAQGKPRLAEDFARRASELGDHRRRRS